MTKQPQVRVYERNAVGTAGVKHICLAHGATRLRYVRNTMFARLFDIVAERNEPVTNKRHSVQLLEPLASLVMAERIVRRIERVA